ncbi:DUF2752 domain-containing protein [Patiriisocius hiemis]|uniref:DUF2752 domain-containing protein n=1 Tax=Patiriisocius hiemis TaxID=3075604 RepID=A0ABU2YDY0_9FLAO|nr:DUF2752 domain-containing protein [Constantimarinum sp. W242]MDT0555460.1 DUF2752 domain-containing protein [Constantimarinum sp. W242]
MVSKRLLVVLVIIFSIVGLLTIYYFNNPSEHSFFIPCPFKFATGYHCPGCGSQRAIHQLLHLDIAAAFRLNPLMVLSLPLIFWGLGIMIWNYIYQTEYRVWLFYNKYFIYGYFGLAVVYWVVRNLPYYPFNLLAPNS